MTVAFADFAASSISALPITKKTRLNYTGAFDRHVRPLLGAKPLDEIVRKDIQDVLVGLSPQTAYQVLMVMKSVFREAIECGLLESAPTDRVRGPRVMVAPRQFLRWEEIPPLRFGPRGRYDNHVRFLALHGLRWGEAAALTEDDIRGGRVHVTKSIHGSPKSAAGVRSVPYLGFFQPFSHDRRGLAHALAPHGVTIHSLRHTYAYLLKTSGIHVTTAQKLLGHASPHLTLAIYTAVLDDEIDAAGEQLRLMARIPGITIPAA